MRDISFKCLFCSQSLEAPHDMGGQQTECPTCKQSIQIPTLTHKPESPTAVQPSPQPLKGSRRQPADTTQNTKRHGVFYYVFWGTVSLFATLIILGVGLFFFTAFGAGIIASLRSNQERHQPNQERHQPADVSVMQNELNDTETYKHSFVDLPSIPPSSGEVRLLEMQVLYWNDVWSRFVPENIRVTYANDNFVFYGKREGYFIHVDSIQKFVDHIEKYREWREQALRELVTLQKDIGVVPVQAWWMLGDSTHFGSRSDSATIRFFSQSTTHHQAIIHFEKSRDIANEYNTHKMRTIYMDIDGALLLLNGLSRDNINRKVDEHLNRLHVQSRFE